MQVRWAAQELSLLFDACTGLPFADHDAAETYRCPTARLLPPAGAGQLWEPEGARAWPLPLLHVRGSADRPTAAQLVWCERALLVAR
jgi:hypothetical protein